MAAAVGEIRDEYDLAEKLADPWWRLTSGKLYKIITKSKEDEDDDAGFVVPFIPNRAQRRFLKRFWYRNIILKARQLGFTTLVAIMWLDYALFNSNVRCGIIAHNREAAEIIFRDKVKFAYENLPESLKEQFPLQKNSASELLFAHNKSSIRVSTSMRSGTIHRLHISEFGKICAESPQKAKEVVTGSIPAVPLTGMLIIESTAEGPDGEFASMTNKAMALQKAGKKLKRKQMRMHFFPWYEEDGYEMDHEDVAISPQQHAYFDRIEAKTGITITAGKRAWYVITQETDYGGAPERMWAEYPSTPEEAFQNSTEGCYYTEQLASARKNNRIMPNIPLLPGVPCSTFWDIGSGDGCAVWVMQRVGQYHNFIRFKEGWGESYAYFVKWLQELGVVFDCHYLPHDAEHVRQGATANESALDMLRTLWPSARFEVVDRIQNIQWGIQQTRDVFPTCYFDEVHCKEGIAHLENYKKGWNKTQSCWTDQPAYPQIHREAADALRQFAQGYNHRPAPRKEPRRRASWRTV